MGYCYNAKTGALSCDSCGAAEGKTRKVKCPFGWCPAPALCPDCRKKHADKLTKGAHANCKVQQDEFKARNAREEELNAAGIHTRCAALSQDNGSVRVMFAIKRQNQGAIFAEMSHACYDSIPLCEPATLAAYEKHSPVKRLNISDFHDQEPEPQPTPPQSEGGKCGKQLHGFMPPCVLDAGHAGDCEDGFGGHYQHEEPEAQAPVKLVFDGWINSPQNDTDLAAELQREKARAQIREEAARPLVGTAGEYGTGDFLDTTAGQMSLFNFTRYAQNQNHKLKTETP